MVLQSKKKKKSYKKKKSGHENTRQSDLSWEAAGETRKPFCTAGMIFGVLAVLLLVLMVDLYFFVDDTQEVRAQQRARAEKAQAQQARKPQNFTRPPKKPTFSATELVDMHQLQQLIQDLEERILVVAFEEATAEGNKKKLWKRWERIARAIPNKAQFKRMDDDELPKIVRFDCSGPQQAACEQLVGKNLPAVVLWKSNIPRFFPEEVRTDTQVYNYLAKQMQEAIKYFDTLDEAELFSTEEGTISLFFFGRDESGAYRQVADIMRDMADFGRTADPEIAEAFEAEVPSLRMYRSFDQSPLPFLGNLSDTNSIAQFVRENSVPRFGEWTASTIKMYNNRKLPVVFLAVDPTEDETEIVLAIGKKLADEFWGQLSFTYLDAIMNADLARQLQVGDLPEAFILSGQQVRKQIDLDTPEESIRQTIREWKDASSRQETQLDEGDEYDDYEDGIDYDEEYDDADLDADAEEEGGEEEEKEEL